VHFWYIVMKLAYAIYIPYFIEYNVHTNTVHTWVSQWFLANILFLFFKNNFTKINHCKFIHHNRHLKPFVSYLPCIVCREYFSIIFNVKECALYSIKYGKWIRLKTITNGVFKKILPPTFAHHNQNYTLMLND